ncbi:MAG TPA: carboxypeptidase-like regulatory domain-containing protein [Gemmatimonadaceae bacterium]|nr:carboxypeptidase-like regulatory domain-containing protein [Gemmatimonadaceae bacterium]
MRLRSWVAVLFVACARPALAQQAHGAVRDALSHQPVPGAVVSALGADGVSLARALSDAAGAFWLALPPGTVRLRVVRIGFHPVDSKQLVSAGSTLEVNFTLEPLPSLLEKVTVSEGEQCPDRNDREQALGLWEQAGAALLASVAARASRPGDMQLIEYERLFGEDRASVAWQQIRRASARTSRPYVPIATAAYFAAHGYRLERGTDSELGAPDVDVLLDDSFAATHCFSIADSAAAHTGEIGLAFEPAPGRDRLVDVRGVLWIDRTHPAVRTLEFQYTGLPDWQRAAGAGGAISFRAMPNGVVFIDSWSIASPELVSRGFAAGSRSSGGTRTRVMVSGGVVIGAQWPDGSHWDAPTASMHGYVTAATGGDHDRPGAIRGVDTAGVRVWLAGTNDTTTTDSLGRFRLDGLLPGRYAVRAAERQLAIGGVAQNSPTDSAFAAFTDTVPAVVHLDSAVVAARGVCGDPNGPMPATVLLVHVVNGDGWNVPRDSVVATWKEASYRVLGIPIAREGRSEGLTDSDGRVAVCDPPRGEPVALVVGSALSPQLTTTVTVPKANSVALATVQLAAPHAK